MSVATPEQRRVIQQQRKLATRHRELHAWRMGLGAQTQKYIGGNKLMLEVYTAARSGYAFDFPVDWPGWEGLYSDADGLFRGAEERAASPTRVRRAEDWAEGTEGVDFGVPDPQGKW